MSVVVSLKDVVQAMDFQSDETTPYLNRRTGEIETINDEDRRFAEDETADAERLPASQRESVLKAREVLDSAGFRPAAR